MKKHNQLGMNPSTASNRLVKDLLWDLVVKTGQDSCYCCGEKMERSNFSIEHKEPWLDSEDPLGKYFDLGNIAFSHKSCNYAEARHQRAECPSLARYKWGCRCEPCVLLNREGGRLRMRKFRRGVVQ